MKRTIGAAAVVAETGAEKVAADPRLCTRADAGRMPSLEGAGSVTLFAPKDEASPADAKAAIAEDAKTPRVLLYRVAEDRATREGGSVVEADVRASDGVIQVMLSRN